MPDVADLGLPPEVQLSHPHDFFSLRHYAVEPNTCFVLMPFASEFDGVFETIKSALKDVMECTRADDFCVGGAILERVMRGIATAELIIADLTDRNPNVFYELGLAHRHTRNVLLLTQRLQDVPFDLRGLFCHTYDPTPSGRAGLVDLVYKAAAAVRARSVPALLKDALSRTKELVACLDRLRSQPHRLQRTIIRHQAGLSSLSNIGFSSAQDRETTEYGQLLEQERALLIACVKGGAALQLMLVPVLTHWRDRERWRARWDRLLEFLRDDECMKRCDVAISPVGGTNLLCIGEDIVFEGYRTAIERGFGLTLVYTDRNTIRAKMTVFDSMFESARDYTFRAYGPGDPSTNEKERSRKVVIKKIETTRDDPGTPDLD